MQIPLANIDSAVLEEVSIPLWTELFEAVGWPGSLAAKKKTGFTHDDLLEAFQGGTPNDELLLALETLHELGTPKGRETINAVITDRHLPLDALPHGLGERELALRLFLKQRQDGAFAEVLSRAQVQIQEGEHRRFNDFIGTSGMRVREPKAKAKVLEDAIREFCKASDLGDHVQVRVFDDDDGTLMFQIIRSHHTRTPLAVIPGSAGRATIKYRPVHSDVVRYESGIARLRITARAASMVEVYRKLFGRVLFGDDTFFYGDPVCSLRVLQDDRQAALDRHRVYGVGRVWMTECIWERSDGQRLTIRAADCFEMIADLNLNITEGELLQAKLKMQVTGKSARPVIVTVRAPSRIEVSRAQYEVLVNEVLDAVGIRNSRAVTRETDLWSLYPWQHPINTWRALFGGDTDALVNAGVLNKILLDAVVAPEHPGAGRVLQAEPVSRGEFFGVSQAPEIPSRSLSATNLDGLELNVEAFQAHLRKILGLSGAVEKPSDDGLLDLGALQLGDYSVRLTYAVRQPPANSAVVVNARAAAGTHSVILLPGGGAEVTGVASAILDNPLPARNSLVRAIAARLNLTEQLPAILTAPEKARLIVDTRRGAIWFDRIEVPDLKAGTHQFQFTELLARNAPRAVSKDALVKHLSCGRSDGDQAARSAKTKAKKAIAEALKAAGVHFEDPFRSENGCYRLTVLPYVV
jgi:hypothetical protein